MTLNPITRLESVENGRPVFAKDLNNLATQLVSIETAAKNLILTDKPVESDGIAVHKRSIVMDCFKVDQPISDTARFYDAAITLRGNDGGPLSGDPWNDTDYAIHLDVQDRTTTPNYPATLNSGSFDTTNKVKSPLPYSIINIDGPTATVRIFSRDVGFEDAPVCLTVNPSRTKLYALSSLDSLNINMAVTVFTLSSGIPTYSKTILLENHEWCDGTKQLRAFAKAFAVADSGNIYLLNREDGYNGNAQLITYTPSGKRRLDFNTVLANDTFTYWCATGMCVDSSENVYVARTCSSARTTTGTKQSYVSQLTSSLQYIREITDTASHGDNLEYKTFRALATGPDGYIYVGYNTRHAWNTSGHRANSRVARIDPSAWTWTNTSNWIHESSDGTFTDTFHQMAVGTESGSNHIIIGWVDCNKTPTTDGSPSVTNFDGLRDPATEAAHPFKVAEVHWPSTGVAFQFVTTQYDGMGSLLYNKSDATRNAPYGFSILDGNGAVMTSDAHVGLLHYTLMATTPTTGSPYLPADAKIRAAVYTTIVDNTTPSIDIKLPTTGNFVPNPGFINAPQTFPGIVSGTRATGLLLRDKPSPAMKSGWEDPAQTSDSIHTYGWGCFAVDKTLWRTGIPDDLSDINTDFFSLDTSSGRNIYTTIAACATNKFNAAYVADRISSGAGSLYIPAVWLGSYGSTDTSSMVEEICSDDRNPDIIPVYQPTTNTEIRGEIGVPVLDVAVPRPWVSGDVLNLSLSWSMHLLDKIGLDSYDQRTMKAYAFLMFLNGSNVPITPANYGDGTAMYRLDIPLGTLSVGQTGIEITDGYPPFGSHKYLVTPTGGGMTPTTLSCAIPSGTERIRLGFAVGVSSLPVGNMPAREDNVLLFTGESGGMHVDDISLTISNPDRS